MNNELNLTLNNDTGVLSESSKLLKFNEKNYMKSAHYDSRVKFIYLF